MRHRAHLDDLRFGIIVKFSFFQMTATKTATTIATAEEDLREIIFLLNCQLKSLKNLEAERERVGKGVEETAIHVHLASR